MLLCNTLGVHCDASSDGWKSCKPTLDSLPTMPTKGDEAVSHAGRASWGLLKVLSSTPPTPLYEPSSHLLTTRYVTTRPACMPLLQLLSTWRVLLWMVS